ncbi:roadblock/LC7 domain-containing protein [Streptomyces chrestomyceticus]|uniref:roadblock/LC7 domain-containing protein n=1 Tax=Streptomyces chrestomyceticus TaxID=68185 RepID=UPI003678DC32
MTTDLTWLMDQLHKDIPGCRTVLLLSSDGFHRARNSACSQDLADRLAAVCSSLINCAHTAGQIYDDSSLKVQHIDWEHHQMALVDAGANANLSLAVVTDIDTAPGLVGEAMRLMVTRLHGHLKTAPRSPEQSPS